MSNPLWKVMRYDPMEMPLPTPRSRRGSTSSDGSPPPPPSRFGPVRRDQHPFVDPLSVFELVEKPHLFTFDVVIVGSGAGSGVMADALASAGFRVLVCEKGSFLKTMHLTQYEQESYEQLYENHGFVQTENGSANILAGSTFGGGIIILLKYYRMNNSKVLMFVAVQ
jgi:hypothetical protein